MAPLQSKVMDSGNSSPPAEATGLVAYDLRSRLKPGWWGVIRALGDAEQAEMMARFAEQEKLVQAGIVLLVPMATQGRLVGLIALIIWLVVALLLKISSLSALVSMFLTPFVLWHFTHSV